MILNLPAHFTRQYIFLSTRGPRKRSWDFINMTYCINHNSVICLFAGDFAYDMHEVKSHQALVVIKLNDITENCF